ncbi:MAG: HNH endonuclease [Pseudonocardia sp.]|nr:HNH endonuclease [Pseudonocardia sp.]
MSAALATAHRLLQEAVDALSEAAGALATDDDLLAVLSEAEGVTRRLDRITVDTVADLEQRGTFPARGYKSATGALSDLLRWERGEARQRTVTAEHVHPRTGLDGTTMPARLPATATVFAAGEVGSRHVAVIAAVLDTAAARRLDPDTWAGAETQLAERGTQYTPSELRAWGTALIDALDQDGPEPDDDVPPPQVNELRISRHKSRPGGRISGRFDNAAMFDTIATIIDAKAKPRTAEDERTTPQRQADALAEVCEFALGNAPAAVVPETGGRRPVVNVLVRLEDLEHRARAAALDFGGALTPAELRKLCCDAAVVPIVMNGAGQPLDVGRATRTIPDGLRRAVTTRDRGCAHPGCDRPPSWAEIHHIEPWENLGPTKLNNLVMVCALHHRLLHQTSDWVVRIRNGLPEFIPPRWIDPQRRPRRKALPHLAGQQVPTPRRSDDDGAVLLDVL